MFKLETENIVHSSNLPEAYSYDVLRYDVPTPWCFEIQAYREIPKHILNNNIKPI
jgi:hypothetical protein